MTITKKVLERAAHAVEQLENGTDNAYIIFREGERGSDFHYIEAIVLRGHWYFSGSRTDEYQYFDGMSYGFTFNRDLVAPIIAEHQAIRAEREAALSGKGERGT